MSPRLRSACLSDLTMASYELVQGPIFPHSFHFLDDFLEKFDKIYEHRLDKSFKNISRVSMKRPPQAWTTSKCRAPCPSHPTPVRIAVWNEA